MISSYLNIAALPRHAALHQYTSNLFYLIRLGERPHRLEVDDLLDRRMGKNKVITPNPAGKAESRKDSLQIRKPEIPVRPPRDQTQ